MFKIKGESMPELPEVEAFREYISSHDKNKTIQKVDVLQSSVIKKVSAQTFKKNLTGKKFTKIERRGKYLILTLSSGQQLIMHFGLTGYPYIGKADQKVRFACVVFEFNKDNCLYWCDVRKFGKLYLVDSADQIKGIHELGPGALTIVGTEFLTIAHESSKKNVKAFLMDQSIIAGIGNEYSDEIMFQAGIDPHHKIKDLSDAQLKKLYQAMRRVLLFAIKVRLKQVKSLKKQQVFLTEDTQDFPKTYLQAHRHTDGKCPHNAKHKLKKVTIAGRSAYYCPIDQK